MRFVQWVKCISRWTSEGTADCTGFVGRTLAIDRPTKAQVRPIGCFAINDSMAGTPILIWFRNDLRLGDNPALSAAIARGGAVIPVFIWSPDEEGTWKPGAASRWWLHQSLVQLDRGLRSLGSRLIVRRGPIVESLTSLIQSTGADAVSWNRRYEPAFVRCDRIVEQKLQRLDVRAETFPGGLLFEPWEILTKERQPFRVFGPFWKACLARQPSPPLLAPRLWPSPSRWPKSQPIESLELEPKIDWTAGFRQVWQPGERGAREQLEKFRQHALIGYVRGRNRPDDRGTSRLSPHLHFGEITPRQVWHEVTAVRTDNGSGRTLATARVKFLAELGWREFAHHVLFHFPRTSDRPLRENFGHFPWSRNPRALAAWQRGKTGFPIVDAGMRELWTTGWMHNRMRMIVASFLTKDLLISWREGARWFWNTLLDADLANNTLGWQWTAGCGADAAPFFRIFNPILQGRKFDPKGEYVRHWIPELRSLPLRFLHEPWKASSEELAAADVQLGKTYPRPIVEHRESRRAALEAFRSIRGKD
jgi:deoxyribodipyrimidine photo-lyase